MSSTGTSERNLGKALMSFAEYNTFQGFYKLTPADTDVSAVQIFNKCILYITGWLKHRIGLNDTCDRSEVRFLYEYPDPDDGSDFDVFANGEIHLKRAKTQFDIAIFALKDQGEWTLRIKEPNNQQEAGYADWLFTTDTALKLTDDCVYLALRTKCMESHEHSKQATPFRPAFLPGMFSDSSIIVSEGGFDTGNFRIVMNTLEIYKSGKQNKDDFEFIKALKNVNRQMPVVFCPSSFSADSDQDKFRISKLSGHLAGEAYVVVDEAHNGYRYLFERMEDFLKSIGETKRNSLEKIKTNYLCINPLSDKEVRLQWFATDPEADTYSAEDDQFKVTLRAEIGRVERFVHDHFLRRNNENGADINFGDVYFYSELWDRYVAKTDSKVIEGLKAKLGDAEKQINELIANGKSDSAQQAQELLEELRGSIEEDFRKDKEAAAARFSDQLKKKENRIEELEEKTDELGKKNKELEESLRKNYDHRLENEKLKFFFSLLSKPFKLRNLNQWVEENMSDRIIFHKNGIDSYKSMEYPKEDVLRNAFILIYADEKHLAGEMSDELYEAVKTDPLVSAFEINKSGGDGYKVMIDGQPAFMHLVYSEHSADMFRIYYGRDKNGKCKIASVEKHA